MSQCYVAKKSCGHIVAAFPVNIDKAVKGKLLEQFTKAGFDIEQATEAEVRLGYNLSCSCATPPLLKMMDEKAEGVDKADIDSASQEDLTPDGSADQLLDLTAEDQNNEQAETVAEAPDEEHTSITEEGSENEAPDASPQEENLEAPQESLPPKRKPSKIKAPASIGY